MFWQDVVLHILFKSAVGFCNALSSSPDPKMSPTNTQPYLPPILRPIDQSSHSIDEIVYPPGLMLFLKALAANKETETRVAFAVSQPDTHSNHCPAPFPEPPSSMAFETTYPPPGPAVYYD